ncbi:hypothetical protein [Pseudomonas syringae]|uniref:hypothetical protein n=1 Tax=Pseudomonas syringae TaxID=317 RepID=UPI0013C3175A|nr:hypothetical protein [Pseudomonas syringae]
MARKAEDEAKPVELTCGLVMPISAIDGCSVEHWAEVKAIICEAVESVQDICFITKLVSDQDDVGVIQKRIVQNIYSSDIVVCDVSCKNANVMFELGMRLAFDKPTILIKDDKTDFSFDTGVIEHLVYPRDLRFSRILAFKKLLAEKISATYQASQNDPGHSTFLKNFGSFKVASVDQTVGTTDQVMLDMIQDLTREVSRIGRRIGRDLPSAFPRPDEPFTTEWLTEVVSAIQKYKKANPTATWNSCKGDDAFYLAILDSCSPSNFKSYEKFISMLNSFMNLNHQLLE